MIRFQDTMSTNDDALNPNRIRALEEMAADTTAPVLLREVAQRVLADPTRPVAAYDEDLLAAMERLAMQIPADVPLEELEDDIRKAREDVRRERLRQRTEQAKRTGTA
jgi:hypothetical protein